MIVFKIIGWILLSVLAIVIALLFVKVRIIAEYGVNPTARLKWLFLEIPLYPKSEKKPSKEKDIKSKKKKDAEMAVADSVSEAGVSETEALPEASSTVSDESAPTPEGVTSAEKKQSLLRMFYETSNGVEGIIQLLKKVVSYLGTFTGGLLSSVVVSDCRVDITVGTRDAAQTAIKYGEICSAAFPLLGSIVTKYRIKRYDFNIEPDFLAYKSEYGMFVDFYVRPAIVIGITLALVFKLLFGVILKVLFNMLRPILKQKAENKDKTKKKTEKSGATT